MKETHYDSELFNKVCELEARVQISEQKLHEATLLLKDIQLIVEKFLAKPSKDRNINNSWE